MGRTRKQENGQLSKCQGGPHTEGRPPQSSALNCGFLSGVKTEIKFSYQCVYFIKLELRVRAVARLSSTNLEAY